MFDRAAKISRTQVTKMRWVLGLHGLASVVFGVMVLAWPGISVYALEKNKMIAGNPNARAVQFFLDSDEVPLELIGDGLLPAALV